MAATKKEKSRFLATFSLPDGQSAFGELRLKGEETLLRLKSDKLIGRIEDGSHLQGVTLDHKWVTCIDCISPGTGHHWSKAGITHYHADIFPHYVTVGGEHLRPDSAMVRAISFRVSDLPALFYDFDAFGHVIGSDKVIDVVLEEARKRRAVEAGEWPQVCYFTGKDTVAEIETPIGKISVNHRPSFSMGGPEGVFIKNRMAVSIEPEAPVAFKDIIDRMLTLRRFLSMAAGRRQGIQSVGLTTTTPTQEPGQALELHWSYARKGSGKSASQHKPHPGDVPLDPINRLGEFSAVLKNWLERENGWRVPRIRYLDCLHNGNRYNVDRLVAAANMFDILPHDALPKVAGMPADLEATRTACLDLLKKHAPGPDRDSALSALGRMGKSSLPKKALHRAAIVAERFGPRFAELPLAISTAVKCRNFFVHGSSSDFDYFKLEHLTPFLTDVLEFVFSASDFIEAGWDAGRWNAQSHGVGHNFARFRSGFDAGIKDLKLALGV